MKKNRNKTKYSRKDFIKTTALGAGGLTLAMNAKGYGIILGANDHINFGVVGLKGRGWAHIKAIESTPNCSVKYLCEVDEKVLRERVDEANEEADHKVEAITDIRALIEKKDVDAITIAAPEHWHVPMALMALRAGKHVFVEKPLSHNPQEGEWMVEAQHKYSDLKIQMGNQQRSANSSIEAVELIKEGLIGDAYYGKAFYAMNRGSIGNGKVVPVPDELDWDLWQGPAPRVQYRDNIVHYNWHWFKHWGIGEIGNNGLHEMDFCRWALDVDYPTRAVSTGGRYNYRDDDWEFYDTQLASYEFGQDNKKMISWEGFSCNDHKFYGRGRGSIIKGSEGSMIVDRGGYVAYNMDGEVIKEKKEGEAKGNSSQPSDTVGFDSLTVNHFINFAESIRGKEELNSPMVEGQKSTLMCHLGNISQETGKALKIDEKTGKIVGDSEATKMWYREYEPDWKPEV